MARPGPFCFALAAPSFFRCGAIRSMVSPGCFPVFFNPIRGRFVGSSCAAETCQQESTPRETCSPRIERVSRLFLAITDGARRRYLFRDNLSASPVVDLQESQGETAGCFWRTRTNERNTATLGQR